VKKLDVIAQNQNHFPNQGVEIVQKLSILCKQRNQCRPVMYHLILVKISFIFFVLFHFLLISLILTYCKKLILCLCMYPLGIYNHKKTIKQIDWIFTEAIVVLINKPLCYHAMGLSSDEKVETS
jgi:hypothetical protein